MKKEWPYTTMVHVCRKMSASVFMAVCTTTLETQTHQIVPSKFATGPRGASFEVGEGEGGGEWEGEMERGRGRGKGKGKEKGIERGGKGEQSA